MRNIICSITILVFLFTLGYAGVAGKISGRVLDSGTGEPLAGVNLILEGSTLGAASDIDGNYIILNVPPGKYILKTIMIGYSETFVKDIIVKIDLTSRVDIELKEEALLSETVIIAAKRPIVTKDISNSQLNIESQVVETLPIKTLNDVLALQAGVDIGSAGIIIRGGGAHQTTFMIDGMIMNDERSNIANTTMSLNSIQEVQIQTGGFNAEYGEARSGLINAISKEGAVDKYNAAISFKYSAAAPKHFGISLYAPDSYFNRPYLDPAVCWTGTYNGAWDSYLQQQYPAFEGWKKISDRLLADNNPDNDMTPEVAQRVFTWSRRRQGDIKKPDYIMDATFGGPAPVISKYLGNLRFYLSYFKDQNMFVFPLSSDSYNENYTQLKLNSDISSSIKLMLTGQYGEVQSVSPYQWTTTPTGRVLRSQSEIADLLNGTDGPEMLYMPGYFSPSVIYRSMVGAKLTHALSPKTYYEVNLQFKKSKYHTYQMSTRDTSSVYQIFDGYPSIDMDEAPYGYWGYSTGAIDGTSTGGWMNLGRDNSKNMTYSIKADITSQISLNHQLKGGVITTFNDYDINSSTYSPSMSTWTRSQIYRFSPFRIGAYLQDKIEYEGFVANIGARFDLSDANTNYYELTTYDQLYRAGYGNDIEEKAPVKRTKPIFSISPRLGIAHPIGENSKLYFNYGHFRQEAESTYRLRLQREYNGLVTSIGNPNLALEKTVSYEVGFEHGVANNYLIQVAGYYKDVTDQPGWITYRNIKGTVNYSITTNNFYEDIRGVELTFTKNTGAFFSGFVNLTYEVQSSGHFDYEKNYEDPNEQRNYLLKTPEQSKPHARPRSKFNLDFHTPPSFGPKYFGLFPLAEWRMNILGSWKTGAYYTYNPNSLSGVIDDTQWRDKWDLDLRLARSLRLWETDIQFYLDIVNLLNLKYLDYAGFSDTYDWNAYMTSLNLSFEDGEEHGDDRIGDYRPVGVAYDPLERLIDNPNNDAAIAAENAAIHESNSKRKERGSYIDNPNITSLTFLNPRRITFGVKISF